MKKLILVMFLMILGVPAFTQSEVGEGIKFENGTWAEILAKAKKENKYVFLDAFTTWCGPCKWMDKEVLRPRRRSSTREQSATAGKRC